MHSLEHIHYIKKIKKTNFLIKITQILIFIFFIILWQFLADKKIINTFIFSSPYKVIKCIINLQNKKMLYNNILTTLFETLISFILSSILGIVIATIMWSNKFIAKVIDPYLTIINSLPKVALGPIIIIWSGASIKSIIIMALLISLIITIINIYQSFTETDISKIKLMKSLGANKIQIYFNLILPASLSNILNTLKINISMSLIGVIMGEFLVSKKGIGYLIMYGSQVFNLDLVISGIIILCILAAIMYYIINYIEKKLVKN